MTKTNSKKNIFASKDALAFWIPNRKEVQAIYKRSYLEKITQVDEIWELLKLHFGDLLAVDSPHTFHPESLSLIHI